MEETRHHRSNETRELTPSLISSAQNHRSVGPPVIDIMSVGFTIVDPQFPTNMVMIFPQRS